MRKNVYNKINGDEMKEYFKFKEKTVLISGKKRGLIQNLKENKVYSIDENSVKYLIPILNGNKIDSIVKKEDLNEFIDFLNILVNRSLGEFTDIPIKSGEININKVINKTFNNVWFELRKACNLKCCHCYMDCNSNRDSNLKLLNLNEWKNIINELTNYKVERITLIGGEPLIFKHITELIDYINLKLPKCEIVLYSNLSLLSDNILNCIIKNKVKVVTSIYSNESNIHNKITGHIGSFNLTVENIKKLRRNNVYVQANSVLMTYNVNNISQTKRFIYDLTGVMGRIDIIRDIGKSKDHLIPKNISNKFNRVRTKADFNLISEKDFIRNYSGNSCWTGKINISCDGYISPCIMGEDFINKDFNIRNYSLEELLDKYIIPSFWSISKDNIEVCKDCEYRYVCKDCRPINKEGNNKLSKGGFCNYNPYTGIWENEKRD